MHRSILTLAFFVSFGNLWAQFPKEGLTLLHLMKCDQGLKGDVSNLVTTTKRFNPNTKTEITNHYGEGNRLLQSREKSAYVNEFSEFEYDASGNLISQITKTKRELLDSIVGFYDPLGRLQNVAIYRGNEKKLISMDRITYDSENKPIKVRTGFALGTRTQELIIKEDDKCTIKHRIRSGKKKFAIIYNQKFKYDNLEQCLDYSERNIRNVSGQKTVEVYKDPETDLQTWVEIDYDDYGNWIKRSAYRFEEKKKAPKRFRLYEIEREINYR